MPTSEDYDDGYSDKRDQDRIKTVVPCTCHPGDPCYFHAVRVKEGCVRKWVLLDRPVETPSTESGGAPGDRDPQRMKELAGLGEEEAVEGFSTGDLVDAMASDLTGHADLDRFIHDCVATFHSKGHDYRQGHDEDLLHNFREVSLAVDEPMEKVWFTYFFKHYSALTTFVKEKGQSESEPIEGRIKDMVVYLLLFVRMAQEMKAMRPEPAVVELPVGKKLARGTVKIDTARAQELAGLRPSRKKQAYQAAAEDEDKAAWNVSIPTREERFPGLDAPDAFLEPVVAPFCCKDQQLWGVCACSGTRD